MSQSLAELKKENQKLSEENQEFKKQVAKLKAIVRLLNDQLHGKKTEVFETIAIDQINLFNGNQFIRTDCDVTEVQEKKVKTIVHHHVATKEQPRPQYLDDLPQEKKVEKMDDPACPECHKKMQSIGVKLARREVRIKQPELYCLNIYQETYKCVHCSANNASDQIVSSHVPTALIPHSYFSASILASVANFKFNLALPFYRQTSLWQAIGLPITAREMAHNIIKVSQTYLEPLHQLLEKLTQAESVIHMDETPFKVVDSHHANGYFWVTRTTDKFAKHQIAVFHYANTRSGQMVGRIMGRDYPGIIMCDGYGGYSDHLYPHAKFGSCLVHIRREFARIVKALPGSKRASKAAAVLNIMKEIFLAEKSIVCKTARERLEQRQEKVRPLVDRFYEYLEHIVRPMGKLKAAILNAQKLRRRVYRIFENGQLPLTNNPVEQCIRPSTLIRKNCLFAKTEAGAQANAVYYSLVATAKLNQLNVHKYLNYLFDHLPDANLGHLEAYLPWAKPVQAACHN